MDEYTNSTVIDDGSDMFLDATEETTEDAQEPVEHAEAPTEENVEEPKPAEESEERPNADTARSGIKIVFRGEERELTYEEAVNLAQKGMHYEGIRQERDNLKAAQTENGDAVKELSKWAKQAGMNVTEYIQYLQTARHSQAVDREAANIRSKYPDMPEEAAKELAEARVKEVDAEELRATEARQQEAKAAEEEAAQAPWIDFAKQYPDIDNINKIPADVMAEIENGARPVEAMQRHEIKDLTTKINELTTKVSQLEQNQKNKEKALPSMSTRAVDPPDPFAEGLFS